MTHVDGQAEEHRALRPDRAGEAAEEERARHADELGEQERADHEAGIEPDFRPVERRDADHGLDAVVVDQEGEQQHERLPVAPELPERGSQAAERHAEQCT